MGRDSQVAECQRSANFRQRREREEFGDVWFLPQSQHFVTRLTLAELLVAMGIIGLLVSNHLPSAIAHGRCSHNADSSDRRDIDLEGKLFERHCHIDIVQCDVRRNRQ